MSALREILAHFSVNVDTHELKEAGSLIGEGVESLKKFGEAAMDAFAVKELAEFIFGLTEQAEAIKRNADAFGLSTKEMQEWQGAAHLADVSAEDFAASFKIMAKNVGAGTGPAVEAIEKLGVKVKDAGGNVRPLGDLFEDAGAAIGGIENAGQRAALGTQVFGRGFIKILPLLSQGREGMAKLREEFSELGGVMDEDFIAKSGEVNDQVKKIGVLMDGLKITIAAELLPAVKWLVLGMIDLAKPIVDVIKHSEALHAFFAVLAGVGVYQALVAIIGAFKMLALYGIGLTAAFFLIEDFLTFLKGGDSEFGRMIESVFGPGSAEKVRNFINTMFSSWSNFKEKLSQIWEALKWDFEAIWKDMRFFGLGVAASLSDAFDDMWRDIMAGAARTLSVLPGMEGAVKKIMAEVTAIDVRRSHGGAKGEVAAESASAEDALQEERKVLADRIEGTRGAGAGRRVATSFEREGNGVGTRVEEGDTSITVQVHVPPGTDATQAKRTADATAEGVHTASAQTKRGTRAALVPGSG